MNKRYIQGHFVNSSLTHTPSECPLECSEWHWKPRNKAETKADTTAVSSYFGAFPDFCRFRKLRYFIKLHLFKAARSTEIWRNPPISESY
jgi:hypothetical protein